MTTAMLNSNQEKYILTVMLKLDMNVHVSTVTNISMPTGDEDKKYFTKYRW